jgi:hypothetical protein
MSDSKTTPLQDKLLKSASNNQQAQISNGLAINQFSVDQVDAISVKKIQGETYLKGNFGDKSYICFGFDRDLAEKSEKNITSITLVAGHSGHKKLVDGIKRQDNEPIIRDPDPFIDAATLVVSQKSNPDERFQLVQGKVGNQELVSSIVAKADAIRIVGQKGIKLITAPSSIDTQNKAPILLKGIDLIAGNNDSGLQPIPKGENLVSCLTELSEIVKNLTLYMQQMWTYQTEANLSLASHKHNLDLNELITILNHSSEKLNGQSDQCKATSAHYTNTIYYSLNNLVKKIETLRDIFLQNKSLNTHINSQFNNTN